LNAQVNSFLHNLNQRQCEAVEHVDGPLLVIAGAGSGKTRMLTTRIAYLVEKRAIEPEAILAVTFTNKAAGEMRERVRSLVPHAADRITLTTFHSFCSSLLRRWSKYIGFPDGFTIFDDEDSERLMKAVINEMGLDSKKFSPGLMQNLVSQAKNDLLTPDEFQPPHPAKEKIRQVYAKYQEKLVENAAMDFDDLIFNTYKMLVQDADLLQKLQSRYRYFLVDEYQDTNFAQYKLVALLSSASRNICVVGDEDQAIYSWRGATIRNIMEFESDFKGAHIVCLDQNYRSTQIILDGAGAVIANNSGSRKKRLWTENSAGDPIVFFQTFDDREEANRIVDEIISLNERNISRSEIAVLFRMNSQSRSLEQVLTQKKIPYEFTGGFKFYQRKEVKDILAYLRIIANNKDSVSLKRIINTPRRGIGEVTVGRLQENGSLWQGLEIFSRENPSSKIADFYEMLKSFDDLAGTVDVFNLTKAIVERTDYLCYLNESEPDTFEERKGNVDSLLSDIKSQQEDNPGLTLKEFLERVALHSEMDEMDEKTEKVHLLTLHNAKGLEFPVVFMSGMEEGVFPHISSRDLPEELEEERRLAYVGMTRAMKRLYLSAAKRRMVFGNWTPHAVSRFVREIPPQIIKSREPSPVYSTPVSHSKPSFGSKLIISDSPENRKGVSELGTMLNLKPGISVFHQVFGDGKVTATEGESLSDFRVTIFFRNVGKKTLLLQYANLRVINTLTKQEVNEC